MQQWSDAWYLLRCRENTWRTTLQNLSEAGIKTCCPLILERRRRRDKKNSYRLINYPAFPGYIFVRFNPAQIHTTAIKRMPGAMDFVRFGNQIATIQQEEVNAMKLIHHDLPTVSLGTEHLTDERVNIPADVLKRIEQIFNAEKGTERNHLMFLMIREQFFKKNKPLSME
ncbi:hypothetical protein EcCFBP13530_22965 [Enterobacter cancerogenus]|uniref:NusG-like N-terminal domain-containing protein n=1 Tax=Enterobacter cancerogenus TaxID=69218 RepID=A0AB38NYS8_9ENTR|nr:transcription termination/antitermination NusG family protein [Enterobacter cancerogenus]TKK13665.1 hypothetical protein EcCFBP13530_22965 [Enterobacter cancerogenus]